MNILHVLPEFPARPLQCHSGITNVVYHLSREQVKLGHEVTVSTSSIGCTNNKDNENIGEEGSPLIFDGVSVLHFSSLLSYDQFHVTPKLVSFVKKNLATFDVVHLHDVRCFQSIVVQYYARRYSRPYVLQIHGSHLGGLREKKLKWLLDCTSSRRILRHATRAIALNTTEAEYYRQQGLPAHVIDIVGNGIDLAEYEGGQRGEFRRRYGISNDQRVILYLGRLTRSKNIDMLVDAFSHLNSSLERVTLVLAGPDKGFKTALKRRVRDLNIEDRTLFTGPLEETEKMNALIDADVLVTPSFTGFPVTFLESCACGTPIVTTTNADNLEWINENVGLVTSFDSTALSQAILRILSDPELETRFRKNCQQLVKKYEWPFIVEQLQETYVRAIRT